ncbi:hypothetical protein NMY22_g6534 [Coprinellus aureogranulatus]|nr:hypothetical protein NMY22_g6534 [Coprinellus aureogranulatus]
MSPPQSAKGEPASNLAESLAFRVHFNSPERIGHITYSDKDTVLSEDFLAEFDAGYTYFKTSHVPGFAEFLHSQARQYHDLIFKEAEESSLKPWKKLRCARRDCSNEAITLVHDIAFAGVWKPNPQRENEDILPKERAIFDLASPWCGNEASIRSRGFEGPDSERSQGYAIPYHTRTLAHKSPQTPTLIQLIHIGNAIHTPFRFVSSPHPAVTPSHFPASLLNVVIEAYENAPNLIHRIHFQGDTVIARDIHLISIPPYYPELDPETCERHRANQFKDAVTTTPSSAWSQQAQGEEATRRIGALTERPAIIRLTPTPSRDSPKWSVRRPVASTHTLLQSSLPSFQHYYLLHYLATPTFIRNRPTAAPFFLGLWLSS